MAEKLKIYLSPSEHGVGANKCRHEGCYEDKHTRPIAEKTAKHLRASGFIVYIASKDKSMAERCAEANRLGVDLYICIHTNAAGDKTARYLMFMALKTTGEHGRMLKTISAPVHDVYPDGKLQLVARTDLYEINAPNAKTIYCEMGFHTNKKDCDEFIHKPDMVGKSLAKGVCKYFDVKFVSASGSRYMALYNMNYRNGASLDSDIIGKIPKGTILTGTVDKNGWLKTTYNGKKGYVRQKGSKAYCSKV